MTPIGEDGSEDRKRSDEVLEFVIIPIAEKEFRYKVIRADKIGKPGIITSQVIQHVFDAELVIADLASENPNVFYELALRHAVRKPFIQIINEGGKIPFDVAGLRTIFLDHKSLSSADKAKRELGSQITAIQGDPGNVESPVTQAIDVQALRGSGRKTEQHLAAIMDTLSDLKGQISQLKGPERVSFTLEPSPGGFANVLRTINAVERPGEVKISQHWPLGPLPPKGK